MNYKIPIMIVDDDVNLLKVYKKIFELSGFTVRAFSDSVEALQVIRSDTAAVVISDIIMPKLDGMQLLREVKREKPFVEVIMLTAEGSVSGAVDAVHQGAFTYMVKPVNIDDLLFNVKRAYDIYTIKAEGVSANKGIEKGGEEEPLIGANIKIENIRGQVKIVAPMDSTVLVTGESGTGKEILANMIHYSSQRAKQPFVRVNCAALSENLLESELFGHEKGAFTGADRTRKGRFELANRGTLLLDEIGELPMGTQAKLLRVLQEKEFERVGGSTTIQTDFRLIAATNRDLRKEIDARRFREDLYYRINVVPIHIPALRERQDDVKLLADYFIAKICAEVKKPLVRLSDGALQKLLSYDWPGNVRELRNIIERVVVLTNRDMIEADMIALETAGTRTIISAAVEQSGENGPGSGRQDRREMRDSVRNGGRPEPLSEPSAAWISGQGIVSGSGETAEAGDLATARREFEKQYILRALDHNEWNVTKTAMELNLARKNLYKKIKEYGIDLKW